MSEILPTKALYYPYIEFQNLDWLKCALLYWEGVKRIIPHSAFTAKDPPIIKDLLASGLVENVSAQEYQAVAATEYRLREEERRRTAGGSMLAKKLNRALDRDPRAFYSAYVHRSKVDPGLACFLIKNGHAVEKGDWLAMPEGTARNYMLAVAGTIAKELNVATVTDDYLSLSDFLNEEHEFNLEHFLERKESSRKPPRLDSFDLV